MKLEKRVATIGEKVYDFRTGRVEFVKSVHDEHVVVTGYPKGMEMVSHIPHRAYEVMAK